MLSDNLCKSSKSDRLTFNDVFTGKDNNFNFIRVVAASFVLLSHCYPLAGMNNFDPFYYYLGGYDTGGGYGVAIFFVISGFLVTKSVLQHDLMSYLLSRLLRIVPGLAFALIFSAFVIGPIVTQKPLSYYLLSHETWRYLEGVNVFAIRQDLPGVFLANPEAKIVNGSLWTLPIEFGFYLILPVIGGLGLLKRWTALGVLLAGIVSYAALVLVFHFSWNAQGGNLFRGAPVFSTARNFIFFFSGASLWLWRDRIIYSRGMAIVMVIMLYIFSVNSYKTAVFYIALPYIVMYLAFSRSDILGMYKRVGDYSYGVYIYAFPVQQFIVAKMDGVSPLALFVIAAPITLLLAVASWHIVEHPALRLRERIFRRENSPGPAALVRSCRERDFNVGRN
ncbi:acyltransferase [Rhodoblastus acidophilus]|uniref:Acyltransferase n=1 Tax=Candidatus Rhodoblastus alkanivorans TaxID=2954117 RepID=A0ABS9ZB89_9HYPH|nr:acyltransferase [Candidatus Rhodoblastus alkanivorans]MCI4679779.1 acyltransferase [Candidatus Rhodoblastus alkanivorans]MCI4684301.1 acyltransferase [Candidatus Rhodoblastus alkanivorans]MDI4641622.1 acyltransferase [Rhodoblastus acidophilus]